MIWAFYNQSYIKWIIAIVVLLSYLFQAFYINEQNSFQGTR